MGQPAPPTVRDAAPPSAIPDPYRPLPPAGTAGASAPVSPEEEPNSTGTLFLMMIFLMMIGGLWVIVYLTLLHR
jgi:hypothetical protein